MSRPSGTAFDVLKAEDGVLGELVAQLAIERDGSVESRARYGDLAKKLIRRVATREAALVDVASVIDGMDGMESISQRMLRNAELRRPQIAEAERMSRGISGMNLNQGQDFDGALTALAATLESEIAWDRTELIPRVAEAIRGTDRARQFRSAKSVQQHAPTNLDPKGPRWYERTPLISRLITFYDRLRDFPNAAQSR